MAQLGKKRDLMHDDRIDDAPKGARKKLKTSKHVARPVKKKKPTKGLLDLPAELRNRIYHFACEEDFGDHDNTDSTKMFMNPAPLFTKYASVKHGKAQWPMSDKDCDESGRKFFGLTQVCRQIRKEYRPIWLSNSSVRVGETCPLSAYLHQFHGSCQPSENMPKLIQITYDHDFIPALDITHLLRLHAAHPTTKIELIPEALTGSQGPWDYEECEWCLGELVEDSPLNTELPDFNCPHSYEHRLDFGIAFLVYEQPFLGALNKLLAHDDAKWLQDLRNRDIARVKLDGGNDFGVSPDLTIRMAHDSEFVKSKTGNKSIGDVVSDYVKSRNLKATNTEYAELHFELLICGSCTD